MENKTELNKTEADQIAEDIGEDIEGYLSGYLATMYPDDWAKLSNSCKRSIKGAIINAWRHHTKQLEKYPWLPISQYKKPKAGKDILSVFRWHIHQDRYVTVYWHPVEKCWLTIRSVKIPEKDMLPYFMHLPNRPK